MNKSIRIDNETIPGFANTLGAHSIGGIILCGMNWGDGGGKKKDDETQQNGSNQLRLFASRENSHPYQRSIIKWFEFWGFKLNPDQPTNMDYALSQTNMFLDSSRNFEDNPRTSEEWEIALERFANVVELLKPFAVLFLSIPTLKSALQYAQDCGAPQWKKVLGIQECGISPRIFHDPDKPEKRFGFFSPQLNIGEIKIAAVPHPAARHFTDNAVRAAYDVMNPWLREALQNYENVQSTINGMSVPKAGSL